MKQAEYTPPSASIDTKILSVVFDILIYCSSSYFPLNQIANFVLHCLEIKDFCILCLPNHGNRIRIIQCPLRFHQTEFIPKQLFYSLTSHTHYSHAGIRPIFFDFHISISISLCSINHASITGSTYLEKSPFINPCSRSILPCTSSSR